MKLNFIEKKLGGHKAGQLLVIALSIFMMTSHTIFGQQEQPRNTKQEQIEKAKIAYINKRLSLNSSQADKFWPVYNDYNDQKTEIKRAMRNLKIETKDTTISEVQIRQDIKALMDYKQKLLNIEKESMDRYLKILSPRQAVDLIKAERDFIKLLYKRLEEK